MPIIKPLCKKVSIVLLFLFLTLSCNRPPSSDKDINVYFNHPLIKTNLEAVIIDFINKAESSIDVAIYDLDRVPVAEALVNAYERGIDVRLITDNDNTGVENETALSLLSLNFVPWIDDTADGSLGSGLQHNKFIIIDNSEVLTGSTNFTSSGIFGDPDGQGGYVGEGNINNIVTIKSVELAVLYTEQFDMMWGDGPGGLLDSKFGLQKEDHQVETTYTDNEGIRIDVQFAPQSPTLYADSTLDTLEEQLLTAENRVLIAQFVFSAQVLADAIKERHELLGIDVRGVGDRGFFYRYYSEFMDMTGRAKLNDNGVYEIDSVTGHLNNVWDVPIEAYHGIHDEADKFHHKFFIIDDVVVTGSQNASTAGAFANDENLLIIHDELVAAQFLMEFEQRFCEAKGTCAKNNCGATPIGFFVLILIRFFFRKGFRMNRG